MVIKIIWFWKLVQWERVKFQDFSDGKKKKSKTILSKKCYSFFHLLNPCDVKIGITVLIVTSLHVLK